MNNYPVGDFLVRLKNAARAHRREVVVAPSKLVVAVAKTLKEEGFLSEVSRKKGEMTVTLAYRKKQPVMLDVKLVSRPGSRVYVGRGDLEARRGVSFLILTTPKGVMTSMEALKKGLGGEVIAEVW
jgi:small subunit ribosomal protein S8